MAQVRGPSFVRTARADSSDVQLAPPFRVVATRDVVRSLCRTFTVVLHRIQRRPHRFRGSTCPNSFCSPSCLHGALTRHCTFVASSRLFSAFSVRSKSRWTSRSTSVSRLGSTGHSGALPGKFSSCSEPSPSGSDAFFSFFGLFLAS